MDRRAALSVSELELLAQHKQAGASHAQVAEELGCACETVRKHWQTIRRGRTRRPRGRPPSGILNHLAEGLRPAAITLKQAHPHWGPINICLELAQDPHWRHIPLPSPSRLAVLFKAECPEAVQPHYVPPPAGPAPHPARQVHQRWQVDTKEKIRLQTGGFASVVDISDPVSSVLVESGAWEVTLTQETYRKPTLAEVRAILRQGFAECGRPAEVHTDHEGIYMGAQQGDFPTLFTLWLVGLGIRHVLSRNRRPTDQGHIERDHRTLADLSWKDQPPKDLADLQAQLDAARERYNWHYPAQAGDCAGQPPLVAHPEAVCSGRPYQVASEWELFDLALVDRYLAERNWVRHADRNGTVFLGNHAYQLGRLNRLLTVIIHFLPAGREFRFESESGDWLKDLPAQGLDKETLTGLIPTELQRGIPIQLTLPWEGV